MSEYESVYRIYMKNRKRIEYLCAASLHTKEDFEDCVHDIIILACERSEEPESETDSDRWILKITQTVIKRYKRRFAEEIMRVDSTDEDGFDIASDGKSVEDTVADREICRRIIDLIPEKDRTVFMMYAVENMTFDEIRKTTNIPISTLQYRISRIFRKLRKDIEQ